MQLRTIIGAFGFMAAALLSGPAFAGTANAPIPVAAEVVGRCTVSATPMKFTVANPGSAANVDSTATVQVQCTSLSFFVISMDNGQNAAGSQRRMIGTTTGQFLEYEIYRNAARANRWGTGFGAGIFGLTFGGGPATYTAYGRIPTVSSFNAADGYSDTVVVTITF